MNEGSNTQGMRQIDKRKKEIKEWAKKEQSKWKNEGTSKRERLKRKKMRTEEGMEEIQKKCWNRWSEKKIIRWKQYKKGGNEQVYWLGKGNEEKFISPLTTT